jgi:tripartite-type tricarboxylate transporter receptor subunit TctC
MIVGFAAGGGTDVSARLFAERLRGLYAPNVVVENKLGAGGRLGNEFVKNAPADGSTLLFTPDFTLTIFAVIYKNLSYDPVKDFIAVAPVTKGALVFSVGPQVPASVTTVKGFLDWAKANPEKANYATTGAGGTPHFGGVMLSKTSGVPLTAVHYRGGAPAMQDLIGGHIASSFNPSSEAIPLAEGGKLRILAQLVTDRSRFLPDTPTMREQGYDVSIDTWTGILVPSKTPEPIVAGLSSAIEKMVKMPDLIEAQAKIGNEMIFAPTKEIQARMAADIEKWKPIVAASGFVPED